MVAALQSQLRPILHGPRTMEEGGQRITPPQRASAHGQSHIQKSRAAKSRKNTPRATKMETVVQRGAYVDKKPTACAEVFSASRQIKLQMQSDSINAEFAAPSGPKSGLQRSSQSVRDSESQQQSQPKPRCLIPSPYISPSCYPTHSAVHSTRRSRSYSPFHSPQISPSCCPTHSAVHSTRRSRSYSPLHTPRHDLFSEGGPDLGRVAAVESSTAGSKLAKLGPVAFLDGEDWHKPHDSEGLLRGSLRDTAVTTLLDMERGMLLSTTSPLPNDGSGSTRFFKSWYDMMEEEEMGPDGLAYAVAPAYPGGAPYIQPRCSKQHQLSAEALPPQTGCTASTESVGLVPFSRIFDDTAISSGLCSSAQTGPEVFRGTDREGEPAASHPPRLDTTWQVWLDANGATDAEFSDVTKCATFSDLVGFSTVWRSLLAQAQALGGRLGIFRQGVTPSIADPRHVDGGRWVATTLPAAQRNVLWSLLVTGVVAGDCRGQGGTEVVTGLVLHVGGRRDRVEVWVGGGDNHNKGKGALSLATTTVPLMVCLHGRLFPKESPTRFAFELSAVQRERAAGSGGFRPNTRQRRTRMPRPCPARSPVGCSRPTGPTDRLHPTASAPTGCSFMAARDHHIDPPRAMTPQPPPPAAPQSMGPAHPFSNPPYARHPSAAPQSMGPAHPFSDPPYARPPSMCPPPPSAVFVHSPYATPAAGLVRSY